MLRASRLTPIVVVHANHANELDDGVRAALTRLAATGSTLLNQSVLLRGDQRRRAGPDGAERDVVRRRRLLPYYLHLLDRVAGAAHSQVPQHEARTLWSEISARLPDTWCRGSSVRSRGPRPRRCCHLRHVRGRDPFVIVPPDICKRGTGGTVRCRMGEGCGRIRRDPAGGPVPSAGSSGNHQQHAAQRGAPGALHLGTRRVGAGRCAGEGHAPSHLPVRVRSGRDHRALEARQRFASRVPTILVRDSITEADLTHAIEIGAQDVVTLHRARGCRPWPSANCTRRGSTGRSPGRSPPRASTGTR